MADVPKKKKREIRLDVIDTIIVNPDKILYEEEIVRAFLPTKLGRVAILPQHTPLYTELVQGKINIDEKNGGTFEKEIDGGIARMKDNRLKILIGF